AAGGQHDDRHRPGRGGAAQSPTHFDPRDIRQHPVEQYRDGFCLGDAQQRLFAVHRFRDREALLLEVVAQQGDERRLILDDQDERFHCGLNRSGATTTKLDLSPLGRTCSSGVPCTRKYTYSATLVAWSPIRSMFFAMNSRWVQAPMIRGSS